MRGREERGRPLLHPLASSLGGRGAREVRGVGGGRDVMMTAMSPSGVIGRAVVARPAVHRILGEHFLPVVAPNEVDMQMTHDSGTQLAPLPGGEAPPSARRFAGAVARAAMWWLDVPADDPVRQ